MTEATLARDILLREYDRMCVEVRTLEANNEKTIAFGLSIVTAAFTVGIAQKVHEIFFVIPLAIVGVFFYAVLLYTYIFSMCGYKEYLENRLNQLASDRVLLWEPLIRERQRDNLIRPVLVGIYLLIASVLIVLSVLNVANTSGAYVAGAQILVTLILFGLLTVAVRRMFTMHHRIFHRAVRLYNDAHPNEPLLSPERLRS